MKKWEHAHWKKIVGWYQSGCYCFLATHLSLLGADNESNLKLIRFWFRGRRYYVWNHNRGYSVKKFIVELKYLAIFIGPSPALMRSAFSIGIDWSTFARQINSCSYSARFFLPVPHILTSTEDGEWAVIDHVGLTWAVAHYRYQSESFLEASAAEVADQYQSESFLEALGRGGCRTVTFPVCRTINFISLLCFL